jgi:hypothetical protein
MHAAPFLPIGTFNRMPQCPQPGIKPWSACIFQNNVVQQCRSIVSLRLFTMGLKYFLNPPGLPGGFVKSFLHGLISAIVSIITVDLLLMFWTVTTICKARIAGYAKTFFGLPGIYLPSFPQKASSDSVAVTAPSS